MDENKDVPGGNRNQRVTCSNYQNIIIKCAGYNADY